MHLLFVDQFEVWGKFSITRGDKPSLAFKRGMDSKGFPECPGFLIT